MDTEGLVVYIKFNGEQTIWDNMIDRTHINYTALPPSIASLQNQINHSFEWIIPFTFRYLYACREFDFIGVFKNESDQDAILAFIHQHITQHGVKTLKIGSCYGEVGYVTEETEFNKIAHQMWGEAVIGAVKNAHEHHQM